jgi:hypothetical protein
MVPGGAAVLRVLLVLRVEVVDRVRHDVPATIPVLRIRDPDFCPSGSRIRISDPGSKNSNKREGLKKFVVLHFFVATKIPKF